MKMKKILSAILVVLLAIGLMSACGPKGPGIDINKTQLYVNVFYAGLGDRWLEAYAKAFEEYYANESFEPGKTGVEVIIEHNYAS